MKRILFTVSTALFWLLMMGLLIHREFFQISAVQAQYQVLPIDLDIREEYNAILMGDQRMGFNFSILELPKKENPQSLYELRHQTYLSFLFLGQPRELLIRGKAKLDRKFNLQEFDFKISSSDYWTQLKGQVVKNNLEMTIESNEGDPIRRTIPLKEPVFFSEALRFLWTPENLKIGKKGTIQAWSPLMGNFQTVTFHVKEKTTIESQGKPAEAFLIEVVSGGIETQTWVNPEGVLLREESATGLTTRREEGWVIFDAMRKEKPQPPDLPNLFSIPSNREIKDPASLKSITVKIKDSLGEKTLTQTQDSVLDLEAQPVTPPELEVYLKSDPWIQSEDPAIIEKAKAITEGSNSALEASEKLLKWVHENVSPVPSLSIPQARQVLGMRKGDCNEYTVLYTAFARAVGIPARMAAGLVYQKGRFFYHAWPEIYLGPPANGEARPSGGRWIAVDPTFNQMPADVTHIPLARGSLEEQVGLVTQLGKIKISILEAQ